MSCLQRMWFTILVHMQNLGFNFFFHRWLMKFNYTFLYVVPIFDMVLFLCKISSCFCNDVVSLFKISIFILMSSVLVISPVIASCASDISLSNWCILKSFSSFNFFSNTNSCLNCSSWSLTSTLWLSVQCKLPIP